MDLVDLDCHNCFGDLPVLVRWRLLLQITKEKGVGFPVNLFYLPSIITTKTPNPNGKISRLLYPIHKF